MTTPLKIKKPNPLDFFGVRQSSSPPAHFEYVSIPMQYNLEKTIARWITGNLKGRFYVGKGINICQNNKLVEILKIGFEDPKELSYFTLACPLLKYN